jgi:hypothetical protein
MSGKTSAEMHKAMRLIRKGTKALQAAKRVGLNPATIYRSRLYKEYRAAEAQTEEQKTLRQRK